MVGLMALLLIVRGLNLGLPYISPKLVQQPTANKTLPHKQIECCHKK
jgi:hypothetical protein